MRKILFTSIVTALLLTACAAQGKTTETKEDFTPAVVTFSDQTRFVLPDNFPIFQPKLEVKVASAKETPTAKTVPVEEEKESSVSQSLVAHMVKHDLPEQTASRYAKYIVDASESHEVDPFLILSIIHVETGGTFKFKNHPNSHGAIGLMQILKGNAKWMGVAVRDLYDPKTNINLGTKYLKNLQERFGHDLGITAYNWGEGNVSNGNYNHRYFNHVHSVFKSIEGNEYDVKASSDN
jgi:soluble lytic murein transglycosylase-like protein